MSKFVTSRGVEVEILAIQTLWERFNAAHRPPDVPQYAVKGMTGVEHHPLTQDIVDRGEATADERAAWDAYLPVLAAWNADVAEKQKRLVFLHGLRVAYPTDDGWIKAQEALGLAVPDNPTERRLYYIETEVCGGAGDFIEIVKRCLIEGLPEEQFRQAEALFRRAMGRFGNPAETTGDTEGQVARELPLPADGGGAESGPAPAVPVRRAARKRPN